MMLPITACAWRIGPAGLAEVRIVERVQRDGEVLYAITQRGRVANHDREWESAVLPSSRDEEFIARTRWSSWEDCAYVAQHMAAAERRKAAS